MAGAAKVETEKKIVEKEAIITAVYKVNLHCQQCARDIKKPLLSTQGVHSVEADFEKSEIKVKGVIDVIKIHKQLQKLSKKKVELVSPIVKIKEPVTEKKVEAKPAPKLSTHSIKVHLHCDKCEKDLRKKLLKHKNIYSVKTDMKSQTIRVEGTIEGDKLVAYMRKKVHKNAEIILQKSEKKEEKIDQKPKVETKSTEKTETVEFKAEKKVEVKKDDAHYFIHYVYAPQFFSDENPHACFIM